MAQLVVWLLIWVAVIAVFVGLVLLVGRRGRRRPAPSSSPSSSRVWRRREDIAEAYDASMIVGYMAGNRRRIEHTEGTTVSRVEPPHSDGVGRVDLDRGTVHVRGGSSG